MAVAINKSAHFYRAMELNMTIGSGVLRDLFLNCLQKNGISMKECLNNYCDLSKNPFSACTWKQKQILSDEDVNVDKMDVTLLTMLLLNIMKSKLSKVAIKHIEDLRKIRNNLTHKDRTGLDDDTVFKDTSALIIGIAASENMPTIELSKAINELRQRELVNRCTNVEKILINNEIYVMKLTEASGNEVVEKDKTLMIKIGLNKWTHELARGLNVGAFLRDLKNQCILSDMELKHIEEGYSYKEQMELLVLHITQQSTDYIYRLFQCLKSIAPWLASVVANSDTDLREIEQYLKEKERENVIRSLRETFKEDEESAIDTDKVHILVEENVGLKLAFNVVKTHVLELFPAVSHSNDIRSFIGLAWKMVKDNDECSEPEDHDVHFFDMKCEEFAEYVGEEMFEVRESLLEAFVKAIKEESIPPKLFAKMTKPEMEDVFSPYLQEVNIKYGYGVKNKLENIQNKINSVQIDVDGDRLETLRDFDKPVCSTKYRRWNVRPRTGSLLVPKDEFRFPSDPLAFNAYYISKEIVRFLAACINGRKNGTIHFGIKQVNANIGQIIGVPHKIVGTNINADIKQAIEICFKENAMFAHRCIRPVQIVPVVDGIAVYEVDVVPTSSRLPNQFLTIDYPPKGYQKKECFVYEYCTDCEILPMATDNLVETEQKYRFVFNDRAQLENDRCVMDKHQMRTNLRKALNGGGNKYLSDEYVPIVVTGKLSGCPQETEIRRHLDVQRLCQSSKLVLDFDDSSGLRQSVEDGNLIFTVQTTEDIVTTTKNAFVNQSPTWLYCNGYKSLRHGYGMPIEDWLNSRLDSIMKALEWMSETIPKNRARIIFLIYPQGCLERDPLEELARLAFVSLFRQQCVFISDSDKAVTRLKRELANTQAERNVDSFFHTGLNWSEVCTVLQNVCRSNPNTVCKLPHCEGHFVEMTKTEKTDLKFTEIDIVSGEECLDEDVKMTEEIRERNKHDSRDKFYKGCPVSWWNFHYKTHVGVRDHFEIHKQELKDKLMSKTGEALIEVHEIEHHPGAGGSTLGMNLLWHFSQFRNAPQKAYRCCIVKNAVVTEETGKQLQSFRDFKEGDKPKPLLILADNLSEDNIILLKKNLHEKAYKNGVPGRLFALIIIINRMPISHEESDGRLLLKHKLSESERDWFEGKFRELETNDKVNVKSLVAFNCLRKSFNPDYMSKMVRDIMDGVTDSEVCVLKCLALICSFESDHPVPTNIFDSMVEKRRDTSSVITPWGINRTVRELKQLAKSKEGLWTNRMSEAMQLLIKESEDRDYFKHGIQVLSQPVAKQILDYIKRRENISLVDIVEYVLEIADVQAAEKSPLSRSFVKIVSSLFKTRQLIDTDKGDFREKFSDLVLELGYNDDTKNGQDHIITSMNRCFKITNDPMLGQQLARYNIHITKFGPAEEAVKESLKLSQPQQKAYLLDTYGQIYKAKAEQLLERKRKGKHNKIPDEKVADIIRLTFQAIEKFKEGQDIAVSYQENVNFCFHTEVRTVLQLLEKFHTFACHRDPQNFIRFLNDDSFEIEDSCFSNLMQICPELEYIRSGNEKQLHVETSLRIIEERNYQVKRELYTIYSENETLLLQMRERFERFYGLNRSGYKFKYGVGLKSLMLAQNKAPDILEKRVEEAHLNLETCPYDAMDERDLLVYLGEKIICVSDTANTTERGSCDEDEYKRLLSYSIDLVSMTTNFPPTKRKYLESFLYYAMLHWPLKTRTDLDLDNLARPSTYKEILDQWEEAYKCNFHITKPEQNKTNKPKNYFALGKGTPGNEIVDLESIRREWKTRMKGVGRIRQPVYADHFWRETFVEEALERLEGTVNGAGNTVIHEAQYRMGTHTFEINTYYPCSQLRNREVTFVLGFTWRGLSAFDVAEKDNQAANGKNGDTVVHKEHGYGNCSLMTDDTERKTTNDMTSKLNSNTKKTSHKDRRHVENRTSNEQKKDKLTEGATTKEDVPLYVSLKPDYTDHRKSKPSKKAKVFQPKPSRGKKKQKTSYAHMTTVSAQNEPSVLKYVDPTKAREETNYKSSASPENLCEQSRRSDAQNNTTPGLVCLQQPVRRAISLEYPVPIHQSTIKTEDAREKFEENKNTSTVQLDDPEMEKLFDELGNIGVEEAAAASGNQTIDTRDKRDPKVDQQISSDVFSDTQKSQTSARSSRTIRRNKAQKTKTKHGLQDKD